MEAFDVLKEREEERKKKKKPDHLSLFPFFNNVQYLVSSSWCLT